jgi:hypothetical protein
MTATMVNLLMEFYVVELAVTLFHVGKIFAMMTGELCRQLD